MVWRHFLRIADGSKANASLVGPNELMTEGGSTKGGTLTWKRNTTKSLHVHRREESAITPAKKMKQQTIVFGGKFV